MVYCHRGTWAGAGARNDNINVIDQYAPSYATSSRSTILDALAMSRNGMIPTIVVSLTVNLQEQTSFKRRIADLPGTVGAVSTPVGDSRRSCAFAM